MSLMRNSAAALAVVSALALGATSASAGAAAHEANAKKTGMHQPAVKKDKSRVGDAGWQRRDPVTGIVRGAGEFVGGVVAGTGAFVSSTVSGQRYGAYSDPYGDNARYRVGANAPAGFSGCATDEGSGRYRECEAGGTGG